ncbi:MAG: hypothetical protein C4320_09635, partial [Armatimonadota bacterium]
TADGDGLIGSPTGGTKIFGIFDATMPYTKNKEIFIDPADPKAIYWSATPQNANTVLGRISLTWSSVSGFEYSGSSPNFRLFEDTGIFGLRHPVRTESGVPRPAETTMVYDARYVAPGVVNPDAPVGSNYRSPVYPFSKENFPGTPRHSGVTNAVFADGHAKGHTKGFLLGGDAPDAAGPAVRVYTWPYDLNGIPEVIAEDHAS